MVYGLCTSYLNFPRVALHVKMEGLLQDVRKEAWDGLIPTELSMDTAEVTSLQRPLPLYVSSYSSRSLVSRGSNQCSSADSAGCVMGAVSPCVHRLLCGFAVSIACRVAATHGRPAHCNGASHQVKLRDTRRSIRT